MYWPWLRQQTLAMAGFLRVYKIECCLAKFNNYIKRVIWSGKFQGLDDRE